MAKFVYVFTEKDKESMLYAGFTLLKSDDDKKIYVFANNSEVKFEAHGRTFDFMLSDTMTF